MNFNIIFNESQDHIPKHPFATSIIDWFLVKGPNHRRFRHLKPIMHLTIAKYTKNLVKKNNELRKLLNCLGLIAATCYGFALITLTGRHLRAARALLGWSQSELSKKAKVAVGTIRRMEQFNGPIGAYTETLGRVVATLEKTGIEFLNNGSPGVRLRLTK
jgi:DNA-binding XRE family transcriptional regulator